MDKRLEIAPLAAVLDHRVGALPVAAPHAAHDGLAPEAGLIGRPQLHVRVRIGPLPCLHDGRELL
jgi:hypothetical protein